MVSYDVFILRPCVFILIINDESYCIMQDPTEQTAIDNFMVQQLDGTVNEWGWCKQKVFA